MTTPDQPVPAVPAQHKQVGQGSTADYCSAFPGEPHYRISHHRGKALVHVVRCSMCGWIDFDDLDQQVRSIALTAIQRRINQTQQRMDAIAATGGFVEIGPAPALPATSPALVHRGTEALEAALNYDEDRAQASLRSLTFTELTYLSVAAESLAGIARAVRHETWPAPGPRLQEITRRAAQAQGRQTYPVELRRRTPEARRAYLAEQRAGHVANGASPAWLAAFDALTAEQAGGDCG